MAGNSFGNLFKITTFGESHGSHMGVVIDGCPAGLAIDFKALEAFVSKRKPGQSAITTDRKETDAFNCVSGIFEGLTTGAPIAFVVENSNHQSSDYEHLKDVFRPSHADFTYFKKYGHRDHRGGGRSSARETLCRVIAGGVAIQLLAQWQIKIQAIVSAVGTIKMNYVPQIFPEANLSDLIRCPDLVVAQKMENHIMDLKQSGDSVGGVISCFVNGVPVGLGEPVFDRLEADLAKAMLSINATKGFEIGGGFTMAQGLGSQFNDSFTTENGKIKTASNWSGGVQGGISNGEPIWFNVAFKPVATIAKPQQTVDVNGTETLLEAKGRHDPCVVPRAVPIVEAMTALVLVDHLLRRNGSKLKNLLSFN